MYFSTVFLLLLTFKFMKSEEIPFDYKYTGETENFLNKATRGFQITFTKKLVMDLSDIIPFSRSTQSNSICELEGTSGQPSAESNDNCTFECNKNNEMYVKFLNTNIYKLKNSLFTDARYIILTLNPINSNIGSCTENKKKGIYECVCKPSYQIIVNERFYDHFLNVVNSNPEQNEDTIKREQFSVFAIFLKFYPQSALFYLAYLFEKCDLNSPLTVFNPSGRIISFRGHDVQGDGSGMVEDKGQFKGHGGKYSWKYINSLQTTNVTFVLSERNISIRRILLSGVL